MSSTSSSVDPVVVEHGDYKFDSKKVKDPCWFLLSMAHFIELLLNV